MANNYILPNKRKTKSAKYKNFIERLTAVDIISQYDNKSLLIKDEEELETSPLLIEETENIIPLLNLKPEAPPGYWKPCHELWKAVLTDALTQYAKLIHKHKYNKKETAELQELTEWFSSSANYVGSFNYICDILFLHKNNILKYIKTATQQAKKMKETKNVRV